MGEAAARFPAGLPRGVVRASRLEAIRVPATDPGPRWDLLELKGRLVELTGLGGNACLTLAFSVVLDAQRQGETVAWVTAVDSCFFPLDAAAAGVDLEALAVVRVAAAEVPRAAERLARSGGFGLLVLDLGPSRRVPTPLQARLRGLADQHDTAVLFLTEGGGRGRGSALGSLVSLRGEASVRRLDRGRFACELKVTKDKRRGPGWTHTEPCRGPDGLY